MKKVSILSTALILVFAIAKAQPDSVSLDLLRAPSSPAASLIGISPSLIEKPSDPAAFAVSIQNATNNFSQLPSSYAVDFAPAWLFAGNRIDLNEFLSNDNVGKTLWQSLVVSSAITNNEDDGDTIANSTKAAFGLKFSLYRGEVDARSIQQLQLSQRLLNSISADINRLTNTLMGTDSTYQNIRTAMREFVKAGGSQIDPIFLRLKSDASERLDFLTKSAKQQVRSDLDSVKKLATEMKFNRHGFKADISLGVVYDFPNQKFENSSLTKAGAWLTVGWDYPTHSILGIVRYLNNPDQVFADDEGVLKGTNINTLDGGIRLIGSFWDQKFLISTEALYRSVLNTSELDPSWRFTLNLEYEIVRNSKLTFSFGRDFDGTITKDGNVIAALNFIKGLGTTKRLR